MAPRYSNFALMKLKETVVFNFSFYFSIVRGCLHFCFYLETKTKEENVNRRFFFSCLLEGSCGFCFPGWWLGGFWPNSGVVKLLLEYNYIDVRQHNGTRWLGTEWIHENDGLLILCRWPCEYGQLPTSTHLGFRIYEINSRKF